MRSRALSMVRKKIGFGQAIQMIDDLVVEPFFWCKKETKRFVDSSRPLSHVLVYDMLSACL